MFVPDRGTPVSSTAVAEPGGTPWRRRHAAFRTALPVRRSVRRTADTVRGLLDPRRRSEGGG